MHSKRCILNEKCRYADGELCNTLCSSFIAIHGHNGVGGRNGAANLPNDYRLLTVISSIVRESQTEAYSLVDRYIATFNRQFESERIKSLYLWSESPGTGKTTTASAILNEYIAVHYIGSVVRGRQPSERPAYFLDVNEWQSLYNGFNRSNVPEDTAKPLAAEYYRQERFAKESAFVVMDDIGVRTATEAFRADLHGVINYRVTNGLPTVYTSNIPLERLSMVFDARLADRIRDLCVDIEFTGESKRGMR